MHYGLLPRAHRGIFAINELPDLASKVQVGLFNILQEGDVQIKGYPVRLRLDVLLVFSANPGGLHGARQDHHAAQGPDRLGDPHALSRRRGRTRWRSPRRKRGPNSAAGGVPVEVPRVRARGRRGNRLHARADQKVDRAIGREPAAAHHHARARRIERRTARARAPRAGRRAARERSLRGAAGSHGEDRARIRGRAQRRGGSGARARAVSDCDRIRRLRHAGGHASRSSPGSSAAAASSCPIPRPRRGCSPRSMASTASIAWPRSRASRRRRASRCARPPRTSCSRGCARSRRSAAPTRAACRPCPARNRARAAVKRARSLDELMERRGAT